MSVWKINEVKPKAGSKIEYCRSGSMSAVTVWTGEYLMDGTLWKNVLIWKYIDENYAKKIEVGGAIG